MNKFAYFKMMGLKKQAGILSTLFRPIKRYWPLLSGKIDKRIDRENARKTRKLLKFLFTPDPQFGASAQELHNEYKQISQGINGFLSDKPGLKALMQDAAKYKDWAQKH